ncbi:MAG: GNAT family N-acetyltransferase [Alphaproteobacteria bacterium]|jgi:GNAT superfamily N-acetyltransferase
MSLVVEPLTGEALQGRLDDLSRLRIEVFRDYPYLYDGELSYERRYLAGLAASRDGVIVVASEGGVVVGASTGAPLVDQPTEITAPFREHGDDVGRIFYFGESVLRRSHRGRGIGVRFFDLREAHARRHGFSKTVFCAVVRPEGHPLRPSDHVPLDAFWRHRGYAPLAGYQCAISWRELGEAGESPKPMQFWYRRLGA